jgi:hypothetical protein
MKVVLNLLFLAMLNLACSSESALSGASLVQQQNVDASAEIAGHDAGVDSSDVVVLSQCVTTCDDKNPCTKDFCDTEIGCVHKYEDILCTDDNVCTVGDLCLKGVCQSGQQVNCKDDNACTVEVCDKAQGCVSTPKVCDDKNVWTADSCSDGECVFLPLQLWWETAIPYLSPDSIPPVSKMPAIFFGDSEKNTADPNDRWIPFSAISYDTGIWLKGFCLDMLKNYPANHWNTGYIVNVGGYNKDYEMWGGHLISLKIVTLAGSPAYKQYNGVGQPVLFPVSGLQEYTADGLAIPQAYNSSTLKGICQKLMAEQK